MEQCEPRHSPDYRVQSQMLSTSSRVGKSLELQMYAHGVPQEMRNVVGFVASKSSQTNKLPHHALANLLILQDIFWVENLVPNRIQPLI